MNPQFDNPEDIDREYARRIEQETDPVRRTNLQVEAAKAKKELEVQAARRELVSNWKELALYRFPEARNFPELVTGSNEQEIMLSAEAAHNRILEMKKGTQGSDNFDQVRQQAQDYYGRGPTTGGTGGPSVISPGVVPPPDMAAVRRENAFAEKFNNAPLDMYGQRMGINPREVDQYVTSRFVGSVKNQVGFWGRLTRSDQVGRR